MKIAATVARLLLGLMFLVFGSNMFLHFISMGPLPEGVAGQFLLALAKSHYMMVVGVVMVFSAILFLANRFVPLALTLLGPVLFNILTFHLLLEPAGIGLGAVATVLWAIVFWHERRAFAALFQPCSCA